MLRTWVLKPVFRLLGRVFPQPFQYIYLGLMFPGRFPRPIAPRTMRDITLSKMMLPDNPDRAVIADKIAARGWVAERVGKEILVPLQDICDSAADMRPDQYEFPYVIKPNHASGLYHFVRNAEDLEDIPEITAKWLQAEYHPDFEWVYRNIDRKLMVETMLSDAKGNPAADLHILCFFGEPALIGHTHDRTGRKYRNYYDCNWTLQNIAETDWDPSSPLPRPDNLDQALNIARKLSADFDMIRVDLYAVGDRIYFSELTNFHSGGRRALQPRSVETELYAEYDRRRKAFIAQGRAAYSDQVRLYDAEGS